MAGAVPRVYRTPCTGRRVCRSWPEARCPRCRHPAPRVWDGDRTALDPDSERPVRLLVTVGVHRCAGRGHFPRAPPPFPRPDATCTDRVAAAAVAAVFADGMALTRVAARLARDFWVRPSEAVMRRWCRAYAEAIAFAGRYRSWVVEEFPGVRCVDAVYRDRLALPVAVDPAADGGDRLVGDRSGHGAVEQRAVAGFRPRLRAAGVEPDQVITDGSALHPAGAAAVGPAAARQRCPFHGTRPATKAVLRVVTEAVTAPPAPPKVRRRRGRPATAAAPAGTAEPSAAFDRQACVARVQRPKRDGRAIRAIVRPTGHSRNTIRRWRREEAGEPDNGGGNAPAARAPPPPPETGPPPAPWPRREDLRQFRQARRDRRFPLVRRPDRLSGAEQRTRTDLPAAPGAASRGVARRLIEEWYAIRRDEAGARRHPDEARRRVRAWQANGAHRARLPLARVRERLTDGRFAHLSHSLARPDGEATNNGAGRRGRLFRHRQAPHCRLRTAEAIADDLRAGAIHRRAPVSARPRCSPGVPARRDQAARPSQDRPMAA